MRRRGVLWSALVLLGAGIVLAEDAPIPFEGQVKSISSGDAITLLVNGRSVRVRLVDVQCPRPHQPFFKFAKRHTYELIFGTPVRVEPVRVGKNGVVVGRVRTLRGNSLSESLLKEGFAWWDRRSAPDDRRLEKLELKARKARRGLWSDENPTAPWDAATK